MAHLHELLAVESAIKARATERIDETITTFQKKQDHFMGLEKSYAPFSEEDAALAGVEERKELTDTVPSKLAWTDNFVVDLVDASLQKETTNQAATGDLIVDGNTIASGLPVTFLLGLETKFREVRRYFAAAPTLQPGTDWVPDPALGDNVYRAQHDRTALRTRKTVQHKILVAPTKEHPAQIEKWSEDIPVGKITQRLWTGNISVADKARLLGRIDKLIDACRQARQRANDTEVVPASIGGALFDYIYG